MVLGREELGSNLGFSISQLCDLGQVTLALDEPRAANR